MVLLRLLILVVGDVDAEVEVLGGGFEVDEDVARRTPFNRQSVGRDPFGIAGLDIGYRLMEDESMRLIVYGQLAMMIDYLTIQFNQKILGSGQWR